VPRPRVPWLLASAALVVSTIAHAEPTSDAPASSAGAAERRSGVVIGTAVGYGLAGASGYPNNASVIGSPEFYSASNLMSGANTTIFVMGALADWVNFGFWLGGGTVQSPRWRSGSFGAGFRAEFFPLYRVRPWLRDLGVSAQVGLGTATLATKVAGIYPTATGSQSFVGAGVFYEFWLVKLLGGHLGGGPTLDYDSITAASIERHGAIFGGRFAFYGGM
jgi:hypothetical protein